DTELFVVPLVRLGKQAPLCQVVLRKTEVGRSDSYYVRIIALSLEGEDLKCLYPLSGRIGFYIGCDYGYCLHIAKRETNRVLPDLLQIFVLELPILYYDIAQSHGIDDAQALFFCSCAYREHGDNSSHSEYHAKHRQKSAELVETKISHCMIELVY